MGVDINPNSGTDRCCTKKEDNEEWKRVEWVFLFISHETSGFPKATLFLLLLSI
jgi:hypothetical protein